MMKFKLVLLVILVGVISQVQASLIASNDDYLIIDNGDSYEGITIRDDAIVNMVGGTVDLGNASYMYDNCQFYISGGTISGKVYLYNNTQIILSGSDFYVGNVAVGLGELDLDYLVTVGALDYFQSEADTYSGTISGILFDGNSFTIDFRILQFIYGSEPETANITLVPEPVSMSLLGLGGIFVCRKKTKLHIT